MSLDGINEQRPYTIEFLITLEMLSVFVTRHTSRQVQSEVIWRARHNTKLPVAKHFRHFSGKPSWKTFSQEIMKNAKLENNAHAIPPTESFSLCCLQVAE